MQDSDSKVDFFHRKVCVLKAYSCTRLPPICASSRSHTGRRTPLVLYWCLFRAVAVDLNNSEPYSLQEKEAL